MSRAKMSLERAREVIQAYGAHAENWPADEREQIVTLIKRDPSLQMLVDGERQLDVMLSEATFAPALSIDAVLAAVDALPDRTASAHTFVPEDANIPEQSAAANDLLDTDPTNADLLSRFLDWLVPGDGLKLWRPLAVASLPFIFGLSVDLTVLAGAEDWATSEQYVFAPVGEEMSGE